MFRSSTLPHPLYIPRDQAPLCGSDSQINAASWIADTVDELNQQILDHNVRTHRVPHTEHRRLAPGEGDLSFLLVGNLGLHFLWQAASIRNGKLEHDLENILFPTEPFPIEVMVIFPEGQANLGTAASRLNQLLKVGIFQQPVHRRNDPSYPTVEHEFQVFPDLIGMREGTPFFPVSGTMVGWTVHEQQHYLHTPQLQVVLALSLYRLWQTESQYPEPIHTPPVHLGSQLFLMRSLVELSRAAEDHFFPSGFASPAAQRHAHLSDWGLSQQYRLDELTLVFGDIFHGWEADEDFFLDWLVEKMGDHSARKDLAYQGAVWLRRYDSTMRDEAAVLSSVERFESVLRTICQLLLTSPSATASTAPRTAHSLSKTPRVLRFSSRRSPFRVCLVLVRR
ncbi:hypothetical protein JCM8547_000414 [Rhodosporidiobolus lusitaniae]